MISSFDEIDKYYEEKVGVSYISPKSDQVKYKYYKSNIGSGVLRRDGLRVELLSKAGEWEERKDLLTKFIGGDCDLDEIPEELALDIYMVADVLGHNDVNTTVKHYAAIEEEHKRQASQVDVYAPRLL